MRTRARNILAFTDIVMKRYAKPTYSSLGPGPRYSVTGPLVTATSPDVPLKGCSPLNIQCRQNANLGSSGVGASGSVSISVYEALDDAPSSGTNETLGAILHSPARNRLPSSTVLPLKVMVSFVPGEKAAGIRLAAEPGTRFAVSKEAVSAVA